MTSDTICTYFPFRIQNVQRRDAHFCLVPADLYPTQLTIIVNRGYRTVCIAGGPDIVSDRDGSKSKYVIRVHISQVKRHGLFNRTDESIELIGKEKFAASKTKTVRFTPWE